MATEKKHISTITSLVDRLHNIMREEQIVGHKAYLDISKMLFLRFIQPHIKPNGSLYTLVNPESYKVDGEFIENYEEIVLKYLDITKLWELPMSDNSFKETTLKIWKRVLAKHPLTKDIFQPQDFFHTKDFKRIRQCLFEIDKALSVIEFDKLTYDVKGVIYEHFLNGYASKAGKEFGQFFTPRSMINMIFDVNSKYFPEMKVNSIYDPCMGTAGFLTEMYKQYPDINPDNIYGGELEPDTYASALMNLLLTTGSVCKVAKCDSLRNNSNVEFDWICTNPPFGIKGMKYDVLLSSPTYLDKKTLAKKGAVKDISEKISIPMKELYPIKTNDPAALFLQHCMSKLSCNGVCNIVLPDGQLITGDKFKKLRRFLIEQYTLKAVIQIPGGAFTHTNIKTIVLIFINEAETCTDTVDFYETSADCLKYELTINATLEEFKLNNYSLDSKSYVAKEVVDYSDSFDMKTLGEVCIINKGVKVPLSKDDNELYPVIGGGGITSTYTNKFNRSGITCKISRTGISVHNCVQIFDCEYWLSENGYTIVSRDENVILNTYLWYYLLTCKEEIYNNAIGTAQRVTNLIKINSIKIPIPSQSTQKCIVQDYEIFENLKNKYLDIIEINKKLHGYYNRRFKELFSTGAYIKLSDVCIISNGERIVDDEKNAGEYPVYGGGFETFTYNKYNRSGNTCKISRFGMSLHNCVQILSIKYWLNDSGLTIKSKDNEILLDSYLFNYLISHMSDVYECAKGSAQKNINMDLFKSIKIPVPSIKEQNDIMSKYSRFRNLFKQQISDVNIKLKNDISVCELLQKRLFGIETDATAEDTMESTETD